MTPGARPSRWKALSAGVYRLSAPAAAWYLTATPDSRYPWLLTGRSQVLEAVKQEIGVRAIEEAQRAAETWIDLTCNYMGTKHDTAKQELGSGATGRRGSTHGGGGACDDR